MTPDAALELSIEQLIGALDKKLFMECARVQSMMHSISSTQVAALTAEIDALEKQARDVLHEVVTLRGSLRSVNRLPPEVLASCAAFVSDTDPRPIVTLTHVCRYWRRSICSSPRSWASIASEWKHLAPLCLERAGAVPLAVDITVPDIRNDEDFLISLLPRTSMIDCLRLAGYSSIETVGGDLPGFFDSPMPNLTSLDLQQAKESIELFPSGQAPVPPVFQNVSKLKSLRLTQTPIYPPLFSIKSLRELKLIGYTSSFHFGTLIGFLGSNLDLELVVLDVQFFVDSVETTPTRKVALTRLQRLSITCSKAIDSRGLLSCISLPRGVHLEIMSSQSTQPTNLASFLPSPPTPIQELLAPITTVKFQHSSGNVYLSGNTSVFSLSCPKSCWHFHIDFTSFPVTAVREFHTNSTTRFLDCGTLSELLGQLPALEVLVLSKDPIRHGVLSVLAQRPVLCPALKTIAFFDCQMAQNQVDELEAAVVQRRETTASRLYSVVIITNNPMMSLDLGVIHRLRKWVPRVEVRVDDKLPDLL